MREHDADQGFLGRELHRHAERRDGGFDLSALEQELPLQLPEKGVVGVGDDELVKQRHGRLHAIFPVGGDGARVDRRQT